MVQMIAVKEILEYFYQGKARFSAVHNVELRVGWRLSVKDIYLGNVIRALRRRSDPCVTCFRTLRAANSTQALII